MVDNYMDMYFFKGEDGTYYIAKVYMDGYVKVSPYSFKTKKEAMSHIRDLGFKPREENIYD